MLLSPVISRIPSGQYYRARRKWYYGKKRIVIAGVGDSNIYAYGTPTNTAPNLQPYNEHILFYSRDGSLPYQTTGHTWRSLNHDSTSRRDESASANGDGTSPPPLFVGQLCGGHGCPVMALANTVQQGTGLPAYAYMAGVGGATSVDWITYLWDQLVDSLTEALSAIPGQPTALDVLCISMGGGDVAIGTQWWRDFAELFDVPNWRGDVFVSPTAEEFYDNFFEFRSRMVSQGWWVPGETQVLIRDIPRNGYGPLTDYPAWQGLQLALTRTDDRMDMVTSIGRTFDPPFPIHYSSSSYTDMGNEEGVKVIDRIPFHVGVP